jgi:hypothetical protein
MQQSPDLFGALLGGQHSRGASLQLSKQQQQQQLPEQQLCFTTGGSSRRVSSRGEAEEQQIRQACVRLQKELRCHWSYGERG